MCSIMEPNLSLYEDALQFYLVITSDDGQLSDDMQFAREKLEENINKTNIKCVTTIECMELSSSFTKKHLVVFNEFHGDCFDEITKTPAIVLGPRCVISCMMDNVALPYIDSPMFNLAMRDLIVCLSSFDLQEKAKLRQIIGYMGGRCIDRLTETVTHLVTESVRTKKYELAVELNMIIMKSSWIYDAWEVSKAENVLATSQKFEKHKLPAFYNLRVTTTGLNKREKLKVEEMVTEGCGRYCGEFSSNSIDIVIARRNASMTDKLKAAITNRKDCLCVEWIYDSFKKNMALPLEAYRIDLQPKKSTSTPERRSNSSQLDNTQATAIDVSNVLITGTVNDTAMSNLSISSIESGLLVRKRKSSEAANENKDFSYKVAFDQLSVQDAKRAGTFLDGCNIFICGFTTEEKEKIVKILNAGGAIRYDTIRSNLTHILIGSPTKKDITMLQTVKADTTFVRLEWLVESIKEKVAVDSDRFLYHLNTGKPNTMPDESAPSPASKRNILLMSGQTSKPCTPRQLNFNDSTDQSPADKTLTSQTARPLAAADNEIIDQYLKAPAPAPKVAPETIPPNEKLPTVEPVAGPSRITSDGFKVPAQPMPACSTQNDSAAHEFDSELGSVFQSQVEFLANFKVHVRGFDTESHESLVDDCKIAGATIIDDENYSGTIDLLILPVDAISMDGIKLKAKTIVNHNWLINAKRLYESNVNTDILPMLDPVEIPYFYKPIFFPEELMPLANLVIVFSLYASDERTFLFQLAQILGAKVEESYCRANKPLLICPEARSSKYEAAIRWRLTVVNKNWLIECYKMKKRVSLGNYLVGESIVSVDHQMDSEDEEIVSSQAAGLASRDSPIEPIVFTNRRVEQLRGGGGSTGNSAAPSPSTDLDSPLLANRNPEILNMLDTPTRESLLQRFKEMEEETPRTKRRRYEEASAYIPECATTPYWKQFKWEQLEERRTRHAPTQEQIQRIQNRTPWSEIKRNLWKEALGDEYESPSQCYNVNMQQAGPAPVSVPNLNDSIAPRASGRQLHYDSPEEPEADENIQMLADLIKKNKENNTEHVQYVELPNTAPPESEMVNSEQLEVIGWRDPSEAIEDTPKRIAKAKNVPCFTISCTNEELKNTLIKQIHALQGQVCENFMKYDSSCTHFICEKPSRSERMLSCVAAGKWVLGLDYIQESFKAKRFLDEEEFEWGNPKAKNLPPIEKNDLMIAKAAARWRKKFQSVAVPSSKGIFKDFRAVLRTTKNESLRNLIEAGRGQVIEIKSNLPLDKQMSTLANVTHIICQNTNTKFTAEEIKALGQTNINLVNMNYLQACIVNEQFPDAANFRYSPTKS